MKVFFIFTLVFGLSACSNLQKSRLPANSTDNLNIMIRKIDITARGLERSELKMRDGTILQKITFNERRQKVNDKTYIDCTLEYFGNMQVLWSDRSAFAANFSSAPIPQGHNFPRVRRSISNLRDSVSGSSIGLVFSAGANQTLSLICEKSVINAEDSERLSSRMTLNEVLAIYPEIRVSDSLREDVGEEPANPVAP